MQLTIMEGIPSARKPPQPFHASSDQPPQHAWLSVWWSRATNRAASRAASTSVLVMGAPINPSHGISVNDPMREVGSAASVPHRFGFVML